MFHKLIACLSSNSKKVLAELLIQTAPVSAQHLADRLNLSVAQARYSVKKVQACLAFNGVEIQQKPNEGILVQISEQARQELLTLVQSNQEDLSTLNQKERVRLLIQIILTSGKGLPPAEIRTTTGISYTSFYRDIEKVRDWLKAFSLSLDAKRNTAFHLAGEELKIRAAMQEILFQNLGQNFLIQACVLPLDDIDLQEVERSIFYFQAQDFIRSMNLPACEILIRSMETKYRRNLFDQTHIELTLYLGIMKNRVGSGKIIQTSDRNFEKIQECYIKDAVRIAQNLLPEVSQENLKPEVEYLSNLLSQCFLHGAFAHGAQEFKSTQGKKSGKLAGAIVNEIAKYLHTGLYEDQELTNCVEWELTHTARTGNLDKHDRNAAGSKSPGTTVQILSRILTPILSASHIANIDAVVEMISNHTLAALERVRSLSYQRRVLLVCGAGVATAFSLRSQLNTLLPGVDVADMVSVFELVHNGKLVEGCDAIITTVPLGNITSIPQITVNALLSEEDVVNIKTTLGLNSHNQLFSLAPSLPNRQFEFSEIINQKAIRTGVSVLLPTEVIEKAGGLLLELNAIWPSYINAMKNLYNLYGPYMVIAPNTALLHAGPEMGSKQLAISLITLSNPIAFGHRVYDPVKIALAFSSPVNSVHTNILTHVFSFFGVPENRAKIMAAQNPEEIMAILAQPEAKIIDPCPS